MNVAGRIGAGRRGASLLAVVLTLAAADSMAAPGPRVVWLWYADGSRAPDTMPQLCSYGMAPPPYACTFGDSAAVCKASVQRWLDRWYADFNLVFTYQRPAQGPYDTMIVTSAGEWCLADERTTSRSPLPTCDLSAAGAVAVFQCRDDARKCASIIAQEQAHILGLEHTASPTDVMNAAFPPDHDGFEDRDNRVEGSCRYPQNSYRLMLERLGPWPGGPKPDPVPLAPPPEDAGPTPIDVPSAADVSAVDATTVDIEAAPGMPSSGCGCTVRGAAPNELPFFLLLVAAILRRVRGAARG